MKSYKSEKNEYTYVYAAEDKAIVTLDAEADDGYEVILVEDQSEESIGFKDPAETFSYHVFMDEDKTVTFEFAEQTDEAAEAAQKADETAKEEAAKKAERDAADNAADDTETDTANDEAVLINPSTDADTETSDEAILVNPTSKSEGTQSDSAETESGETAETETAEAADSAAAEAADQTSAGTSAEIALVDPISDNTDNAAEAVAETTAADASEAAEEAAEETTEEASTEDSTEAITTTDALEIIADDAETENPAESEDDTDVIEENTEEISNQEDEETTDPDEHFLETAEGADDLDASVFSTARLVVLTSDASVIIDPEHQIANYGSIYLMQYGSVEQAMNAYVYYNEHASAVEPDIALETASETEAVTEYTAAENTEKEQADSSKEDEGTAPSEISGLTVTEEENPVAALQEEQASETAQEESKVIALIDTGTSERDNVIDRVSLIDDALSGGTHGDAMADYITEVNPGAKILSIRALGDNGYGSISAVVSAIEYAVNSKVDIINLSMYAKKSVSTSVLETEIQKAVDAGIAVVGAAGNDGADVENYIPGSIEGIWTIGAATKAGTRRTLSNYGDLVDYYVVGASTSEAAARFSGYISLHGTDAAASDATGLIFTKVTENRGGIKTNDESYQVHPDDTTIFDPAIENYVKEHADKSYVGEGKFELVNVMNVKASIASEDEIKEDETIDSLFGGESSSNFLVQQYGMIPVYSLSEDSDYFVAFADVMHNDKNATVKDTVVAEYNVYGVVIDGCHYDTTTGLVYIPKTAFYLNGEFMLSYLQIQLLYSIANFDFDAEWDSSVLVTTESENGKYTYATYGSDILLPGMSVQVGAHMDINSMFVTVNGFPVQGETYSYNADTGYLTLNDYSSATVQSLRVKAQKSEDDLDVEPGLTAAGSYTWDTLPAVSDTPIKAKMDNLSKGQIINMNATLFYSSYDSNISGTENQVRNLGYTPVYAYKNTNTEVGSAAMYYYATGASSSLSLPKIYDHSWALGLYPFGVELKTMQNKDLDFSNLGNIMLMAECLHITKGSRNFDGNIIEDQTVSLRILHINKTAKKPYIVFAFATAKITTQNGTGIFKVYTTPEKGYLTLTKKLMYGQFSAGSDRIKLDTEFTIYTKKSCSKDSIYKTVKVKAEGNETSATVKVADMKPGIYYLKETGRCPGCIYNDHLYQFTITSGDGTNTFKDLTTGKTRQYIPNEPFRGKFQIMKTDAKTGKALAGAVFQVKYYTHKRSSATQTPTKNWYFKADENGIVTYDTEHYMSSWTSPKTGKTYKSSSLITLVSNDITYYTLPMCYLYVREVQAPTVNGTTYKVDYTEHELQIVTDKTTSKDYTYAFCPTATITIKNTPVDNKWLVRIQLKKVDENGNNLAGAEFDVFDEDPTANPDAVAVGTLKSEANGMTNIVTVNDIPWDTQSLTLYVKETLAPDGYTPTTEVFKVTYKRSDYEKLSDADKKLGELKTLSEAIVNKSGGWKMRVNLKKIDGNGNPLQGAVFTIYKGSDFTKSYGTLTSGADGSTEILTLYATDDEEEVTWSCVETSAPEGYTKSAATFTLTFTKADDWDTLSDEEKKEGKLKTFKQKEEDGTEKDIVNEQGWQVQVNAKKVDKALNGLAGATFTITNKETGEVVGTITSGADGMTDTLTVSGLDKSIDHVTLTCTETAAPAGYTATTATYDLTFTKADYDTAVAAGQKDGELKTFGPEKGIINTGGPTPTPPDTSDSGVYVKKTSKADDEILDLNSYTLEGAEFTITDNDGFSETLTTGKNGESNIVKLPDKSWEETQYTYDKEGNVTNTQTIIHYDRRTYYVSETKAPEGHETNLKTESVYVVMPTDKNKIFEVDFDDTPIFCNEELEVEKLGVKGEPIKGAVYKVELFDGETPSDPLKKTWYLESDEKGYITLDDSHISHRMGFKSDSFYKYNGEIVIPIGCYLQFTEVAAPAEYEIDDRPIGYITSKDAITKVETENPEGENVDGSTTKRIYDDLVRCKVNLNKYEDDGTTPIDGVEFKLKFVEEAITPTSNKKDTFKRLLNVGETITRTTDEQGQVSFDDLDQGKYEITEVKTKQGKSLLKDKIVFTIPMTMTDDEANAYGNVNFDTAKEDESYTDKWFFYECTYDITNSVHLDMPMSGASGYWKYGILGGGIIGAMGVAYAVQTQRQINYRRKKHHGHKKRK